MMLVGVVGILGRKELTNFVSTGNVAGDMLAIAHVYDLVLPFLILAAVHGAKLISDLVRGIEYGGPVGFALRWFAFIFLCMLGGIPAIYFGANLWVMLVLIAVKVAMEFAMAYLNVRAD